VLPLSPIFRYLDKLKIIIIIIIIIISGEIKSRTAAGNRCLYSLRPIFRSRPISNSVKIKMYKRMAKQLQ